MGLYGWRLIGVTGTILVYVAGIIFLSVSNIPGPHHPKRVRVSRFGEVIILCSTIFILNCLTMAEYLDFVYDRNIYIVELFVFRID